MSEKNLTRIGSFGHLTRGSAYGILGDMAGGIPHISSIQAALREAGLHGWLFYDFRGSDPLAERILRLDPTRHTTRRWYYLVPAQGWPIKILHRIEPHSLDRLPGYT